MPDSNPLDAIKCAMCGSSIKTHLDSARMDELSRRLDALEAAAKPAPTPQPPKPDTLRERMKACITKVIDIGNAPLGALRWTAEFTNPANGGCLALHCLEAWEAERPPDIEALRRVTLVDDPTDGFLANVNAGVWDKEILAAYKGDRQCVRPRR